MNHATAIFPKKHITREDALSKISKSLKTDTVSHAVIPLDSGQGSLLLSNPRSGFGQAFSRFRKHADRRCGGYADIA